MTVSATDQGGAARLDPALGQVYTPPAVAELALALALEGMPPEATLLDPACGDGVFLSRALAAGVAPARLEGVDVDRRALALASSRAPGCRLSHGDFLTLPVRPVDVVVGNPPWIRQERLGLARKREIARQLMAVWPDLPRIVVAALEGRADLSFAFVARALRWLRPGGRLAFVLSQASFDAGYGTALAELLDGRARLLAAVASQHERWFTAAAVHGVIVVLERLGIAGRPGPGRCGSVESAASSGPARWARLRVPVTEAAARVHGLAELAAVADVRRADSLEGAGPRLRAPDEWFAAAAAGGDALVPLGELAEIRRGATSGANAFFYLTRGEAAQRGIEPRFLAPLLKGPRDVPAIRVDAARLPRLAFCCSVGERELARFPGAAAYVAAHGDLARRRTLAGREPWWRLAAEPARVFLVKAYDERFAQPFASAAVIADQRLYPLSVASDVDVELLAAVLNGSLTALALESLGRASMGAGALELAVADARRLPVLDPRRLLADRGVAAAVRTAFRRVAGRAALPIAAEALAPDRRALDEALLAGAPPALRTRSDAIRRALVTTVAERRERSRRG